MICVPPTIQLGFVSEMIVYHAERFVTEYCILNKPKKTDKTVEKNGCFKLEDSKLFAENLKINSY